MSYHGEFFSGFHVIFVPPTHCLYASPASVAYLSLSKKIKRSGGGGERGRERKEERQRGGGGDTRHHQWLAFLSTHCCRTSAFLS